MNEFVKTAIQIVPILMLIILSNGVCTLSKKLNITVQNERATNKSEYEAKHLENAIKQIEYSANESVHDAVADQIKHAPNVSAHPANQSEFAKKLSVSSANQGEYRLNKNKHAALFEYVNDKSEFAASPTIHAEKHSEHAVNQKEHVINQSEYAAITANRNKHATNQSIHVEEQSKYTLNQSEHLDDKTYYNEDASNQTDDAANNSDDAYNQDEDADSSSEDASNQNEDTDDYSEDVSKENEDTGNQSDPWWADNSQINSSEILIWNISYTFRTNLPPLRQQRGRYGRRGNGQFRRHNDGRRDGPKGPGPPPRPSTTRDPPKNDTESTNAANRFTTKPSTSKTDPRRTPPYRENFTDQCDYYAKYCMKAYDTGKICGRTIYFYYHTFKNYCMMDFVNCKERMEMWQLMHMGACYKVEPLASDYMHYRVYDDGVLKDYYVNTELY